MMQASDQKASSSSMNSSRHPATKFIPCSQHPLVPHPPPLKSFTQRPFPGPNHAVPEHAIAWRGGPAAHLAVPYGGVAPGIRCEQAAEGVPAAGVHDRVAWEGPVQVLLYLQAGHDVT